MERYEFEMIPVPNEALIAAGIVPGVTVEAFVDGSRIVIQKAPEDDFCGECLKEQMNEYFGEDGGDE